MPAPRSKPFLIQPQDVGIRRQCAAFADFGENIDARGKLAGKFVEDVAECRIAAPRERPVRAFSELNVIVDGDEAASETVGEKAGDEKRQIANFTEAVTLTAASCLECAGQPDAERLVDGRGRRSIEVNEAGEQVYQVERREIANGEMLVLHRRFDQLLEVFGRRFMSNKRLGHVPPIHRRRTRTGESAKGVPAEFWGEIEEIIMRN